MAGATAFLLALKIQSEGVEKAKADLEAVNQSGLKLVQASKAQQTEINKSTRLLQQMASVVDRTDRAAIANLQKLTQEQKKWAHEVGATAEQLLKIESVEKKLDGVAEKAEKGSVGVRKLGKGFETLATELTGVHPVLGRVAASMSEYAVGGVITAGVLAGIAVIALAFRGAIEAWNDARKASDELIGSLASQGKALRESGEEAAKSALQFAKANLARVQAANAGNSALLGGLKAGLIGAAGGQLPSAFIITGEAANAANAYQKALDAVAGAQKALGDIALQQQEDRIKLDNEWTKAEEDQRTLEKQIAAEHKQAAAEEKQRFDARLKALTQAIIFDDLRARAAEELGRLENVLTKAVANGNNSLERRIDLEEKLAIVRQAAADAARITAMMQKPTEPTVGITPDLTPGKPTGGPLATVPESIVKKLPPVIMESGRVAVDAMQALNKTMMDSVDSLAQTLGDGVYNAFRDAFSGKGIGAIFSGFAKTVLAGLGTVFRMIGVQIVIGSALMVAIKKAIQSWNPAVSLAAGIALIALGGALGGIAGGAAQRGFAQVSGQGGGGETTEITRLKFVNRDGTYANQVVPMRPVVINAYGPNDPKTQRWMLETFEKAQQRAG